MKENLVCNGVDSTGFPKKKCIHRKGCRLFVDNHQWSPGAKSISAFDCINSEYISLDRYRYSDGTPMKQKETE